MKAYRATGATAVIIGAPDELDICEEAERLIRRFAPAATCVNLAGRTTLRQLAACLHRCDLAVSNDTGPMHLAAAVGTPVVGVFTCTDPVRSGPGGRAHEFVRTAVACAGSYNKTCPLAGAAKCACLQDVQVAAVWDATVRCLRKNGLKPRPPRRASGGASAPRASPRPISLRRAA